MRGGFGRENLDGPKNFFQKIVSLSASRNLITNEAFALCSALLFAVCSAIAPGHSLAAAGTV